MEARLRTINFYESAPGRFPALEWLENLRDQEGRRRLWIRLRRLERGNPGHWRSVGGGVVELKVDAGPGYRLYLGEEGPALVLLLLGGTKASQGADIATAQAYWAHHIAGRTEAQRRHD